MYVLTSNCNFNKLIRIYYYLYPGKKVSSSSGMLTKTK